MGELPTSIREVKGLLGKLNFASLFVPNYTKIVAPIVRLLSRASDGIWKAEHTSALNQIVEIVLKRIQLGYYDITKPAYLHVDVDEGHLAVTLV